MSAYGLKKRNSCILGGDMNPDQIAARLASLKKTKEGRIVIARFNHVGDYKSPLLGF